MRPIKVKRREKIFTLKKKEINKEKKQKEKEIFKVNIKS